MEIAQRIGWCAFSVIQILGTIAVMSQVAWPVFAIFVPVTAICIWYQVRIFPTSTLADSSFCESFPIFFYLLRLLAFAPTAILHADCKRTRPLVGNSEVSDPSSFRRVARRSRSHQSFRTRRPLHRCELVFHRRLLETVVP